MGSFGFGAAGRPRLLAPFSPPAPDSFISPSEDWTGTAASGFASTPTDPARTTAKPAMRLLVPPNQFYTDELLVGVIAGANDGGSLYDNMGLSHVTAHFEGNSVDIAAPSFETFDDANGNPVTYFGWWVRLKHDGRLGAANLYFEAVPSDASMQHRIMGPYAFFPNDTLHDYEIEIAASPAEVAGSRYKTILNALIYLRQVSARNPRVTFTEAGTYDFPYNTQPNYWGDGYCTFEASVPVTIGKAARTTDVNSGMRIRYDGLCFRGENITFDMRNFGVLYNEGNRQHWLDGCRFVNSAGRGDLWRKGYRTSPLVVRNTPWFTEVYMEDQVGPFLNGSVVRGCTAYRCAGDVMSSALAVVGTSVDNISPEDWATERDALTVTYSGAGASATIELNGTSDGSTRTFTARVDGASVGTFTVYNSEAQFTAGTNYHVQNVVDWLNGLSGWSAALIDDTRRASALALPGAKGLLPATNVKGATLTLVTFFDVHTDWYQQGGPSENIVCYDNSGTDMVCQNIFPTQPGGAKDFLFLNCAFYNRKVQNDLFDYTVGFSQLSRGAHSHVVVAHCSMPTQGMSMRPINGYNPDGYCLVANNALRILTWDGVPDADLPIAGNHLQAGNTDPEGATQTSIGGDDTTLFADAAAGDFAPAGALLANLKVPVVRYDLNGNARGATAAAGAR